MLVLLMPMEEKEGALASAEAWAWAVPDGVPADMVRDENGMFVDLAATLLEARLEARNTGDGLGGMTRIGLFYIEVPACMLNVGVLKFYSRGTAEVQLYRTEHSNGRCHLTAP